MLIVEENEGWTEYDLSEEEIYRQVVEDQDGNEVTDWSSYEGYETESKCPEWIASADQKAI